MVGKREETVAGGNFPTLKLVYMGMSGVCKVKEGAMVLRLMEEPRIDNLRNYPADLVDKLRTLLVAGAQAYPDPSRKQFYDLENGSRMFYIHLSPTGKVWLLATWLKQSPYTAVVNAARDKARV